VDASLLPRGGTASDRLVLAWSSQKLLLWNAGATVATAVCRAIPRPGRGTSRAQGLVLQLAEPACGSPRINASDPGQRLTRTRSRRWAG